MPTLEHRLASHTLHREEGMVTLQPSSCRHSIETWCDQPDTSSL